MLVIREAFGGASKFSEFSRQTGAAKNILTQRLDSLCKDGILKRVPQKEGSPRHSYVLTPKGLGLFPIIVALGQWGDKWVFGSEGEPVIIVDKTTGAPIQPVTVFSHDGRHLKPEDVGAVPGPGANDATKAHLKRLSEAQN